ncbi:hypothetical protein RHS01_11441 [Rhizoctonia solani]|uniref:Uncharacterized protein n=1 Tax=Rhizoctonia solani TaxID=456999 RepID=A0A8H7I3D2_9AGAM|nr:hypothetical protein RHS01_11441 [Rhizoctonia solani]
MLTSWLSLALGREREPRASGLPTRTAAYVAAVRGPFRWSQVDDGIWFSGHSQTEDEVVTEPGGDGFDALCDGNQRELLREAAMSSSWRGRILEQGIRLLVGGVQRGVFRSRKRVAVLVTQSKGTSAKSTNWGGGTFSGGGVIGPSASSCRRIR